MERGGLKRGCLRVLEGKEVDDLCAFKNTHANDSFVHPHSPFPFYDAVISSLASAVRSRSDNFSSRARRTMTKVIDAENFINTTAPRGEERLPDESSESTWHDTDEFVGGEEEGEGRVEERVQELWDYFLVETILSFQNHKH